MIKGHDIIVVGASAGGVESLTRMVHGFNRDLPASLFVVLHLPGDHKSFLPKILARADSLPAGHPNDGEPIGPGKIYVAPPDHHLLLMDGRVRLSRGPKENAVRPAVDVLFRSAARTYGPRVVGVVLSGLLDDGTAGLWTIKQRGGIAVVQDPDDAPWPDMPTNAMRHVEVDHRLAASSMSDLLTRLANEPAMERTAESLPPNLDLEVDMAALKPKSAESIGVPSPYACPDCHGVLNEIREGNIKRYRCRTGHAYSRLSLAEQQRTLVEDSLWTSLRAVEEYASLLRELIASDDHKSDSNEQRELKTAERHIEDLQSILADANSSPPISAE